MADSEKGLFGIAHDEECFLWLARSVVDEVLQRYGVLPEEIREENDLMQCWIALGHAA